jgi:octaprenyl-diphosphate synthase
MTQAVRDSRPTLAGVQEPVLGLLEEVGAELRRIVVSDFRMIEDVNDHLLFLQGKLFRPTLLLLAASVDREPDEDVVTLAAVVELVHLATLVHDDAVDHSVLRRGQPTVNALWTHQVAIIMGDYLYSRAISELTRLRNIDALAVLAGAANEMSIGEMRQLTSYDALDFTEDDYYRLIAAKTASLMSAACEMGALVGAEEYRKDFAAFGHNLGMAFQIADDMLDYTGTEAVTGKPPGQDLRERKVTLPLVGAMANANENEIGQIREFFSRPDASDDEIRAIVDLVERRGGIEYSRTRAQHYADRARSSLSGMVESPALDALWTSVSYVVDRNR